jgi:hypothetical protein
MLAATGTTLVSAIVLDPFYSVFRVVEDSPVNVMRPPAGEGLIS